jgi:hypothetical protein
MGVNSVSSEDESGFEISHFYGGSPLNNASNIRDGNSSTPSSNPNANASYGNYKGTVTVQHNIMSSNNNTTAGNEKLEKSNKQGTNATNGSDNKKAPSLGDIDEVTL